MTEIHDDLPSLNLFMAISPSGEQVINEADQMLRHHNSTILTRHASGLEARLEGKFDVVASFPETWAVFLLEQEEDNQEDDD